MTTHTLSTRQRPAHAPNTSKVMQRSIALLAGLLGLLSIYGGAKLLIAGIAHYQASAFIEHWEQQPSQPSEQAWHVADTAIKRAINTYPASNGEYLEKLGYIQQWHDYGIALGEPSAQTSRQAAVQAFREATQARPTWPSAWAALAYGKLTLLEFDAEFTQALQQAQHFGPWRIGINRRIAEIGLIALPALNVEQSEIVFTAMQRTAKYSAKERTQLFNLATETNTLEALCQVLQAEDALCKPLTPDKKAKHE